jgi:HAD superfamily hydrolase (TIGR01509 family)
LPKPFLLFDNDGVLVDTEKWYFEANRICLAEIGVTLDQAGYLELQARGGSAFDRARVAGVEPERLEAQREKRDHLYQHYLQTEDIDFPGVRDTLEQLSQNHRMAIVTTSRKTEFDLIHKNRPLIQYMDFVLTQDDYEHPKPHPQPFLTALARFKAEKSQALVIEDSRRGLQSALNAGIDCYIVRNRFTEQQDFTGAQGVVASFSQILDIVR